MTVFGAVAVLGAIVGIAIPALAASPWEEYLERPTPDNAARVQSLTYSSALADPRDIERGLMLLEIQVVSRDTKAVQLAFRLLSGATGHIAERLDIMLGRLIRVDAALFLRELKTRWSGNGQPWPLGRKLRSRVRRSARRSCVRDVAASRRSPAHIGSEAEGGARSMPRIPEEVGAVSNFGMQPAAFGRG